MTIQVTQKEKLLFTSWDHSPCFQNLPFSLSSWEECVTNPISCIVGSLCGQTWISSQFVLGIQNVLMALANYSPSCNFFSRGSATPWLWPHCSSIHFVCWKICSLRFWPNYRLPLKFSKPPTKQKIKLPRSVCMLHILTSCGKEGGFIIGWVAESERVLWRKVW